MKHYSCSRRPKFRRALGPVMVIAAVAGFAGGANAMDLDTGNPDLKLRWDNSLRYTAGWRMEKQNTLISNHLANDESEYKFADRGDMVTNRVDLLSEFDFVYQRKYGFRVSGSAWYDQAYHDASVRQNPKITFLPSSVDADGKYSSYTKRYYRGLSGEFLDAFVFGGFDIAGVPLNIKLGQHTVYWGQALFYTAGISYSQAGLDLAKATANPGSEVKELFLPVPQISFQSELAPGLSLAGQYIFDWKEIYRFPAGGTYFGPGDFIDAKNFFAAGLGVNGGNIGPERKSGNWGLNINWRPDFMGGGSLAATYRELDEKLPWLFTDASKNYLSVVPRDTKIYGLSVDFPLGPVAMAAEISYRKNAGLKTIDLDSPLNYGFSNLWDGPRGNVTHFAMNGIYLLPKTPIWDTGVMLAEIHAAHLNSITKNAVMYKGVGHGNCLNWTGAAPGSWRDGCGTKNSWGFNLGLTPQWLQVWPGIDLSAPISAGYQVKGNEPDQSVSAQGSLGFSIGIEADMYRTVKVNFAYNGSAGKLGDPVNPGWGNMYGSANGLGATISDRDWISLTIKSTF